ncbi:hypothetical protein ACFLTM_01215 [Candidatus Bipolaricaulota bacterium]
MSRRGAIVGFALIQVASFALSALAQEAILTFSISPQPVTIAVGGEAEVRLAIENTSVREADDIEVAWIGSDDFAFAAEPEPIKLLNPFESGSIRMVLATSTEVAEGARSGRFEVIYTYCIGDVCYQIVEELDVDLLVEPADDTIVGDDGGTDVIVGETSAEPRLPWPWIGFGLAFVFTGAALAVSKRTGGKGVTVAGLALLLTGALAYGVVQNQHEQAQAIGAVLCTSCVGIEDARASDDVRLSAEAIAALGVLDEDVELTVFYAVWCHSCPYAEAMVERMAEASDRIDYTFVDVETAPELAERHGIIRSGRTVVPAITRAGSDEVLFGIEDLEDRLLRMLGVGE